MIDCNIQKIRMKKSHYYILFGALLLGLLVRVPGIYWGNNFPTGWHGHHPDEYTHLSNAEWMINPEIPTRWSRHPYPNGMAAHVAIPLAGLMYVEGKSLWEHPERSTIIVPGRVVSVIYGTATIFVVFLLARCLFRDPRIALIASWTLALGGLHVSQSHYFLSDVPNIFWYLLGSCLLLYEQEKTDKRNTIFLMLAATCFGISFGLKLTIFILPTLALVSIMYQPRFIRILQAGAFFCVGFVVVNFGSYTPYDIAKTFFGGGVSDPYQFSWWSSLILYLIELPSVVSFPVVILTVVGGCFLIKKLFTIRTNERFLPIVLIIIVPLFIYSVLIVSKIAHFPRHLVFFIPWISIVTAWSLVKITDWVLAKGFHPTLVVIPFFVYLAIFVYDGEKVFLKEPRNEAGRWLIKNVTPGTTIYWSYHWFSDYESVGFPMERPPVLIMEMHEANHCLSGMGLRNSYPKDYRFIFDCESQETVQAFHSLFKGESEYKEVARFKEGYFMPEYTVVDNLIGNRSRNYVAEIVVFEKK